MEQLKDIYYPPGFYARLAEQLATVWPPFDRQGFYREAVAGLEALALKERMRRTTVLCHRYLPRRYEEALEILYELGRGLEENQFSYLFMPEYVALYGREHYERSIAALRDFTPLSTSELAVRPYLEQAFERTLKAMRAWAEDENPHVRRLASEGSRPRLPWAPRVQRLLREPQAAWPILERLREDAAPYVQKSVANHLNDISKDHPEWLLTRLKGWPGDKQPTAWIIKHGARSLIKQGHPQALALFGFAKRVNVAMPRLILDKKSLRLGESLCFTATLESQSSRPQRLVVDYKIHYVKQSGRLSEKVFKLREIELAPAEKIRLTKTHAFKPFTTRKHYAGLHHLELMVNGRSMGVRKFRLEL